jgi:hypothetical protein
VLVFISWVASTIGSVFIVLAKLKAEKHKHKTVINEVK